MAGSKKTLPPFMQETPAKGKAPAKGKKAAPKAKGKGAIPPQFLKKGK